ncbi:alpha/beta fold hydrolase [Actinomadura alba]|uniref:Alpha/beta fold hydrolase n=1 Tax=Actinomadura alba TaxID=406431 RepID=A0ABR7LR81_9ACTN|nr:alpha/beta fold hydrolase [Actinomadura alba]MBC6467099.1 alpha/beta fold hydrolase [Actinomadura alba]
MPCLRIDDAVNLHYDIHGRSHSGGEPVLLVTGTSTSVGHWTPTIIDSLAADRQIIAYDHDIGASSPRTEPVSVAALAADAAALLDELGTGPVHVVGWALGSTVAQELALARPDMVAFLLLYGTWGRGDGFQRRLTVALRSPGSTVTSRGRSPSSAWRSPRSSSTARTSNDSPHRSRRFSRRPLTRSERSHTSGRRTWTTTPRTGCQGSTARRTS